MRKLRLVAIVLVACGVVAVAQQKLDVELQLAIQREMASGDLKAAIVEYRRIAERAERADRAVASRALLRLAEAHARLGQAEARGIYERIVRDFPDQTVTADARQRLAALANQPPVVASGVPQLVWTGSLNDGGNGFSMSPDGRQIAYLATGNGTANSAGLFVRDLASGTERHLASASRQPEAGQYATFSPDGNQLVYMWYPGNGADELRLIPTNARDASASRLLFNSPEVGWIEPHDWTPDGKSVSVYLERGREAVSQLGLLSLQDGSLRILKTVPIDRLAAQGMAMRISPDGKYLAYDIRGTERRPHDVFVISIETGAEIHAVAHAADDELIGWSPDGLQIVFASDRHGTRDLWTLDFRNGTPGAERLVSVGPYPGHGRLTRTGTFYYWPKFSTPSYLKSARLDPATGRLLAPPVDAVSDFIGRNSEPVLSNNGRLLAYLSDRMGLGGSFVIAVRSVAGGSVNRDLVPKLRQIGRPTWWPDDRSLVVFGIDATDARGTFRIDLETGAMSKLGTDRLIRISGDGRRIFWDRTTSDGQAHVVELDVASGRERDLSRVDPGGPFRLALSSDGGSLYLRRPVPSSPAPPELVARDLVGGSETILVSQRPLGALQLSPDGQTIVTQSNTVLIAVPTKGGPVTDLGAFRFGTWGPNGRSILATKNGPQNQTEWWWVPVDGSAPDRLELVSSSSMVSNETVSADGQMAFLLRESTPSRPPEIWALENFLSGTRR